MKRSISFLLVLFFTVNVFAQKLPSKIDVIAQLKLVNDYWISQNPDPGANVWARSAYFTGNMDFYKAYPKDSYLQYSILWATNNDWSLNTGSTTRFADNQVAGQTYIDLYLMDSSKKAYKIEAIRTSIDNMINSSKTDDWSWVDALYMAMPVFAKFGNMYNNTAYFDKMYSLFYNTKVTRDLFNDTDGLWYRDEPSKKLLPNGTKTYWSRGNGWVFAAFCKILPLLPETDAHRQEYIETFQKMAPALKNCQRSDGFWNVNLANPLDYGGPETSGTAFFTYGMAWGINNGYLDSATYYPVVVKAWKALTTVALQPSGFLGYVQGAGWKPASSQPVTVNSTQDFGVGAFLLAGTEVAKLAEGKMPVPSSFSMVSVSLLDKDRLQINFNKAIDETTSLDVSNYSINNDVTVLSVAKVPGSSSLILNLKDVTFGFYKLVLKNIKSADGNMIETGESKSFSFFEDKAVTASGFEVNTTNTPDKTLDNDYTTRWSADGIGQWIMYDLGRERKVESVDLAYYSTTTGRKSNFVIQLSTNGTDFSDVCTGVSSGTTNYLENYDFADQNARYVKIIGNGNNQNLWNSITEARINWTPLLTSLINVKESQNELVICQNPYRGSLLTLKTNLDLTETKVCITDLSGKIVYSELVDMVAGKITLSGLSIAKGVYILSVQDKSGLLMVI